MVLIPDQERITAYSPVALTTAFAVGFPILAAPDVEVWIDDVLQDSDDWTMTLGSVVDGFYSSAIVTLDTAVENVVVEIVGSRRPYRTEQYQEGRGVPASSLNRDMNRLAATMRELYDRSRRSLTVPPGAQITEIPAPEPYRVLAWSPDGTQMINGPPYYDLVGTTGATGATGATGPIGATGPSGPGTGDVNGPGSAITAGHAVVWGASNTLIASAGFAPANVVHTHDDRYYTESEIDAAFDLVIPLTAIGSSVQTFGTNLESLRGLTLAANKIAYATGAGAFALTDFTSQARTLNGRTSFDTMRSDLSAAAKSQTGEAIPLFMKEVENETFERVFGPFPHAVSITRWDYGAKSGTVTLQLRKTTAAGSSSNLGSALSVTSAQQGATGALALAAGDWLGYVTSANASCLGLYLMLKYTRNLD